MLKITVISSVLIFSIIILLLVLLLNIAEKKLMPQGDAKILINGKENKVSEVLRSYGIRNLLREIWPIISYGQEILWIPGVRKSDLLKKYEKNKESNILVASVEKSSFEHS